MARREKVSVPYRGAIFLNGQVFAYIVLDKIVSVPYRGAIFLNRKLLLTVL